MDIIRVRGVNTRSTQGGEAGDLESHERFVELPEYLLQSA